MDVLKAEILINQAAQGMRPMDDLARWFASHTATAQQDLLQHVGYLALQAGARPTDAAVAAEKAGVVVGAPCCVLMAIGPPKSQLAKVLALPPAEHARSFLFLVALLSTADERRRSTRCRDRCDHWWHRDLSDEAVVAEILRSRTR